MTASTIPVARPFSTGRVGAGIDAALTTAERLANAAADVATRTAVGYREALDALMAAAGYVPARPVLSREALDRLLGEHYATGLAAELEPGSPWKVECACGTVIGDTTDAIEDGHIRHLADVLDGAR